MRSCSTFTCAVRAVSPSSTALRAPIPVILVSGDFADASPEAAARFGVAAVLPKPFEPEQLLDALARVTGAAI